MDENTELLKTSLERIEGLMGEVKELRYKIKDGQGNDQQKSGGGEPTKGDGDAAKRLKRIEERLDYLGTKWLELDERIFQLQRQHQH